MIFNKIHYKIYCIAANYLGYVATERKALRKKRKKRWCQWRREQRRSGEERRGKESRGEQLRRGEKCIGGEGRGEQWALASVC